MKTYVVISMPVIIVLSRTVLGDVLVVSSVSVVVLVISTRSVPVTPPVVIVWLR